MIFDYFIACCFYQICFGISLFAVYSILKSTDEDSLWRMIIDFGSGKDGIWFNANAFYPIVFFLLLLPIVCNYYTGHLIPTEVFLSRDEFVNHAKDNWGKMLIVWLISVAISTTILETIFKNKIKDK